MKNILVQLCEIQCLQWQQSRRRVYSSCGLTPTLCGIGRGGGNTEPKILIRRVHGQQNKDNRTS